MDASEHRRRTEPDFMARAHQHLVVGLHARTRLSRLHHRHRLAHGRISRAAIDSGCPRQGWRIFMSAVRAATVQVVHEAEAQRQHARYRLPARVRVNGTTYTIHDWSVGGFSIADIDSDLKP